jgi:aminoglycoside 6-adenylyltransferase
MHAQMLTCEQIMHNFVQWAQEEEDIRLILIIGSRGRVDHPADQWADLDLLFVTTDPYRYLTKTDWLDHLGVPWLTYVEDDAGVLERRVLFEGGVDVDFVPLSLEQIEKMMDVDLLPLEDVILPGIRILLDKDGLAEIFHMARTALAEAPTRSIPPHEAEVIEVVNNFWYHALWVSKKLRRGELWYAKWALDWRMKVLLLRMLEWHARATHGWDYNTWKDGRFLEEWADPRASKDLRKAYAHYDQEDIQQALVATIDLFCWLTRETMALLNYAYPHQAEQHITALMQPYLTCDHPRVEQPTHR